MTQPSLFSGARRAPVLYSGRTAASRAASQAAGEAVRASGAAATQCARLLAAYRAVGATGLSDAEASAQLGIRRYVVPARRRDLERAGYVIRPVGRWQGSTRWAVEA